MEDINFEKVTQCMKQIRKERHITQEQIAKALNCTVAFVSNVENNRAKLNLRMLSQYSEICNVPMERFLIAGAPEYHASDAEEVILDQKLIDLFHTQSIENRRKIVQCLEVWTR